MEHLQRIRQTLKWLIYNDIAKTDAEIAKLLGYTKSSFSQIVNGRVPMSDKFISKLCSLDKNINSVWLLTDEGEMLNESGKVSATDDSAKTYALVPLINVDSVGGIHSDNAITITEQYTIRKIPFTDAREGDVAILQSGNSMSPTIPPGSVLLIREVVNWQEYLDNGVYVIWLKDDRRITKEIRRYAPDPQNYLLCVSYNPDVADEPLPRSLIRGVWKVVKYIADFGW